VTVSPFYPLDLRALPGHWEVAALGDVVVEMRPGFASGQHNRLGTGVPHLRPMNVSPDGKLDLADLKYVSGASLLRVRRGDILFNNTNSPEWVGKTAVINAGGDMAFSNHMTRLRVGSRLQPEFLALQLHYFCLTGYFRQTCTNHVNQASVSLRDLKLLPLIVPPVDEQGRIVAAIEDQISRLDAGSAGIDAANQRLINYEHAVLHAATVGRLSSTTHLPQTSPARGTSDDSLPLLQAGWRWAKLGSIADVVGGVAKDTKKQSGAGFVEVPYLRVANVQRGRLDLREVTRIRVPAAVAKKLTLLKGDVLMNEGGDRDKLGRGWVWDGQIPDCIHQNHVFRVRVRNAVLDPRFLSWHGNTFGQAWFQREGKQTTNLASISLNRLRQLPVPVPPFDEQRAIVGDLERRLSVTGAIRIEMGRVRSKARKLRVAILSAAFTGRLSAGTELGQAGRMREALAGIVK
jgi:type I restriction enzyme S subunit